MAKIVLVDFGASRVKSVLVENNTVLDSIEVESPSTQTVSRVPGHFVIPADNYVKAFNATAITLVRKHRDVTAIYICSEMHGFALKYQNESADYISWKDQRADISRLDKDKFKSRTGMTLRTGLPFATLSTMIITNPCKFYTLVDYVLAYYNVDNHKSSLTLAASTGLVDIRTKNWSNELLHMASVDPALVEFLPIAKDNELGTIQIDSNSILVRCGFGDFQSAILGAGIGSTADAVINLGTGSQVACVTEDIDHHEVRPLINDKFVKVFTHIPSGRALNIAADFVNSISPDTFWTLWNKLTVEDILAATPTADLNFFSAAWRYTETSGYILLREGQSNITQVLPVIARSWIEQYIQALNLLDPNIECKQVALAGGLAHKSTFILEVLNKIDPKRDYFNSTLITEEETFDGLLTQHIL